MELSLAICDSKTFNAYVTLPKIGEEITNENDVCNFTEKIKSEDDEWDEIIANLKKVQICWPFFNSIFNFPPHWINITLIAGAH